jgi:hypothetical protein
MKFKSDIEIQAGLKDKDGQAGSNGQILASTGSQVDWIDPASIVTSATDVIIECKNTSGATITKGTPVYQTGNVGATAVIEVAVADASDEAKMAAIGLLQSDLVNNAFGYVVVTGELLNITTSPIDGTTPSIGDTIYVKPGGGLTLTKPTGVNFIQNVGLVGKVSGGNAGSLTVSSIMRSNDVPTPLYVDHTNQRLGIGATSPSEKLDVRGNVHVEASSPSITLKNTAGFTQDYSITNQGSLIVEKNGLDGGGSFVIKDENDRTPLSVSMDLISPDVVVSGDLIVKDRDGTTTNLYVQESNGNVGIGTTAPSQKLEVAGNIKLDGDNRHIYFGGNNTFIGERSNSTELELRGGGSSSAQTVYIDNTGNVGIGTNNPTKNLEIGTNAAAETEFRMHSDESGKYFNIQSAGNFTSVKTAGSQNFILDSSGSSGYITMVTNASERMRVNYNGNIGIGTTSPVYKLDVRSSGNLFYGQTDLNNNTSVFRLKGNGGASSLFEVLADGNVGIGTTNPNTKLHVNGDIRQQGSSYSVNITGGTSISGDNHLDIAANASYLNLRSPNNSIFYRASSDHAFRDAGGSNEYLRIKTSGTTAGNVGIGTTSPGAKLEVAASATTSVDIAHFSNSNGVVKIKHALDTLGSGITSIFDASNNEDIRLSAQSDSWFNAGNVGIGTTSPLAELDVNGTARMDTGVTEGTHYVGSSVEHWGYGGTGMEFPANDTLSLRTANSDRLYINSSGNVGIGTTSPGNLLHIVASSNNVSALIIQDDARRLQLGRDMIEARSADGSTVHNLYIQPNGNVGIATSSGSVGIGTTSPGSKLQVYSTANRDVFISGYGTQAQNDWQAQHAFFTSAGQGVIVGKANANNNTNRLHLLYNTSNGDAQYLGYDTSNDNKVKLNTNGDSFLNGGNVGIGTTSPGSKLHLADSSDVYLTLESTSATTPEEVAVKYSNSATGIYNWWEGLNQSAHWSLGYGTSFSGSNTKLLVHTSGNVGIGTTSPSSLLHLESASSPTLQIKDTTNNVTFKAYTQDSNSHLANTSNHDLFIDTNNTSRITVKAGGNVGIGTTSPGAPLDVKSNSASSADSGIRLIAAGGSDVIAAIGEKSTNGGRFHLYDGGNAKVSFYSDGTSNYIAAGNVGIGTTNPNAKLNVNGSVKIEGTNPLYFGGSGSVPNWEIKAYGSGGNDLLINDAGTNSGDLIFTGQDFGVGTTNPSEKLHVSGEPHPSIRLSSSSDSNYNVVINCGYRNEALNLSVGGYKVFTTEGYNTPETTHLYSNNSKALSLASNQAATFTSTVTATNFINSSDERLKENIEKVCNNNLDVKWKTFEFKSDKGQKRYGVIAQELEKTNPEFVREDAEGFKSVAYIDLLIAKIAELEERIQELEK